VHRQVKLTSRTIVISRSTVRSDLDSVSVDGSIFRFKHPSRALRNLRKGKVMLLQGSDVRYVTKVAHKGRLLVVTTQPATLPQVIGSGKLTAKARVDFRKSFLVRLQPNTRAGAAPDGTVFVKPSYPYVGSAPGAHLAADQSLKLGIGGSSGLWSYSFSLTPVSASRVNVQGAICYGTTGIPSTDKGASCGARPSGLSASVSVDGFIDAGREDVNLNVDRGVLAGGDYKLSSTDAGFKLGYTAARGDGDQVNATPAVFKLPFSLDETIPVLGGIPLYLKVQAAILLKLGISAKNTVLEGGAAGTANGSVTMAESHGKPSGDVQGGDVGGTIQPQRSTSLGNSGVVVALQFPKIGVGLGVSSVYGIAYTDLITSIGQAAGAEVAGNPCSVYDLAVSWGGGFEAQAGPFGLLFSKRKVFLTDPKNGGTKQLHFC
jgi:hypothetical protein